MRQRFARRGGNANDAQRTGIERRGHPSNGTALTGRIPALKHQHGRARLTKTTTGPFTDPFLQLLKLGLVGHAVQCRIEVDVTEGLARFERQSRQDQRGRL